MRYIRAFFLALWMTLRGQVPPSKMEQAYPALAAWHKTATIKLQAAYHATTPDQRQSVQVKVDGRMMRMETILGGVKHHLETEYVYLMDNPTEHSLTALYAANMNDMYWTRVLAESNDLPEVAQAAVMSLSQHLEAIPPTPKPEGETST